MAEELKSKFSCYCPTAEDAQFLANVWAEKRGLVYRISSEIEETPRGFRIEVHYLG